MCKQSLARDYFEDRQWSMAYKLSHNKLNDGNHIETNNV